MVLPLVILLLQQFLNHIFYRTFILITGSIVITANTIISIADTGIYNEWHTHLNYRALSYLNYANEASAFSDSREVVILLFMLMLEVILGIAILYFLFKNSEFKYPWNKFSLIPGIVFHLLLFPVLFIGMRGGLQQIPINESSAYFSSETILNDAAINCVWNAAQKLLQNNQKLKTNPYLFFPEQKADRLVRQLYAIPQKDSVTHILTTGRPNIVLFVLESFTADIFESLGGDSGVTPNLDSVIHQGLLFTNIYSQGYRTDQGLAAVLSGFPATPNYSVMMQPEKYPKLSFLPEVLAARGYQNSFYYGGELDFANMKAYLFKSGISNLYDKSSFKHSQMNAKWGAHDEFVFKKEVDDSSLKRQPFFSTILSLSSHEPFEIPMSAKFPGNDVPSKFKSCCYYTDHFIGEYLRIARTKPWYSNTLFIFVADHGHILPRNRSIEEAGRFHIPIIFYGDVLKPEYKNYRVDNIGMQCDLASTILYQLNTIDAAQFHWSNNLLNRSRNNFAYYSFDSGFGFVNEHGKWTYKFTPAETNNGNEIPDTDIKYGKAFLQKLYEEYLSL